MMCRRSIGAVLVLVLVLAGGAGPIAMAGPQTGEAAAPGDVVEDATKKLFQGDYEAALPAILDIIAYSATRYGGSSAETPTLISHFSDVYWQAGAWVEAERFYAQVLVRLEPILGESDIGLAQVLSYASAVQSVLGRYDAGLRHYRRAREILLASAGPQDARLGMIAFNLARALEDSGQWSNAEDLYKAALDNWRQALDPSDTRLDEVRQSLDRVVAEGAAPVAVAPVAAVPVIAVAVNTSLEAVDTNAVAVYGEPVFGIHLSSVSKSAKSDPSIEWQRLQALYPKLLQGLEMQVSTADLGTEGGLFYRIIAGPLTRREAQRKCERLAEREAWCQTVRTEKPKTG